MEQYVRVEPLKIEHLQGIVDVHNASFPDEFFTELGDTFLRRFYESFLRDTYQLSMAALSKEGNVVGFIASAPDTDELMRKFIIHNVHLLIILVLAKMIGNRIVFVGMCKRMSWFLLKLPSLIIGNPVMKKLIPLREGEERNPFTALESGIAMPATLNTIAVLPGVRGSNVAAALHREYAGNVWTKGFDSIVLQARKTNLRARKFYEKMGYSVLCAQNKHFVMILRKPHGPSSKQ